MAASTTYTTSTLIGKLITPNYDASSAGLDSTQWTEIISQVSREIDAVLRRKYVPFNSTTATPPTPGLIRKIATWLGAAQAVEVIRGVHRGSDYETDIDGWRQAAQNALEALVKGSASIPEEAVTDETLTFGTAGTFDLQSDMAFLAIANYGGGNNIVTVVPESIRVTSTSLTQYHVGTHISVHFHPEHQRWYVWDRLGQLRSAATPKVSYEWTYERHSEFPMPGITRSGKLQIV